MMMSGSWRISARTPSAKPRSIAVLHLHLVERRLDHLDRVLDGADVDLRRGQRLERRIQRGGLARAGRPGDQHDAVGRARSCRFQRFWSSSREAELARNRAPAPRDRRCASPASRRTRWAASTGAARSPAPSAVRVLMRPSCGRRFSTTSMRAEDLDAAGHRGQHRGRDLVDLVQHAVDAEAHDAHARAAARGGCRSRAGRRRTATASRRCARCAGRWRRAACRSCRARPAARSWRSAADAGRALGLAPLIDLARL